MNDTRSLVRLIHDNSGYLAVVIVSALVACWLGSAGLPAPQGDESFYKSPAAELALNGRLAIPCIHGFLPHAKTLFANYPPLYQLVLAGWFTIYGFSWRSSLAFTYLVHALNAIAISAVANRLLHGNEKLAPMIRQLLVAAPGLIHVANLAYFDRPEELALLWIWIEVLFVRGSIPGAGSWRSFGTGVLVGLAALSVPWIGVLSVFVVTLRTIFAAAVSADRKSMVVWRQAIFALAVIGLTSGSMSWAWHAIMDRMHPGVIDEQLATILRYHERTQLGGSIVEKIETFFATAFFNPPQLSATIVVLLFFPLVLTTGGAGKWNPMAPAIYVAGLLGMLGVATIRPGAYPYLGACQMLILPCFAPAMRRFVDSSGGRIGIAVGTVVIISCTILACSEVGRLLVLRRQLPGSERVDAVFARIEQLIPPNATVAVTPRHWYLFQNRNDWREAYLSCLTDPPEILNCEWLVLYPEVGIPPVIDAFEFVSGNPGAAHWPGSYEYSIWRRRRPEEHPEHRRESGPLQRQGM